MKDRKATEGQDDGEVIVGQESVYGRTTKLDPSVPRDEGINIDGGYFPLN